MMISLSTALVILLMPTTGAFAPIRISTAPRFATFQQASDKPLTELCEITKEACDAVAPMLSGKLDVSLTA